MQSLLSEESHIFQVQDCHNLAMLIIGRDQPWEVGLSANSSTRDGFQGSVAGALSQLHSLELRVFKTCYYGSHSFE